MKIKAKEAGIDTTAPAGAVFNDTLITDGELSISEMTSMAENWIDIEDNKDIQDQIVDDELDAIDVEDLHDSEIEGDSESENDSMQPADSNEGDYTKMQVMECLEKVESYLIKNDLPHRVRNMVNAIKYTVQAHHMQKQKKIPSIQSFFRK